MTKRKNIAIDESTFLELARIKTVTDARSYDEVIKKLLDIARKGKIFK